MLLMNNNDRFNLNFVYSPIEIPSIFESAQVATILVADRFALW